jgi:hypothetical protein
LISFDCFLLTRFLLTQVNSLFNMKDQDIKIKSSAIFAFIMYFVTFLSIMGLTALTVIFTPALNPNIGGSVANLLVTVLLSCVLVMTIPFIISIGLMKMWTEPQSTIKPKQELIKGLKSINSKDFPFEIVETDKYDLLLRFKLADAKWKGILFKGGFKKVYWLYLKFDESKNTVYCCEKTRELDWDAGVGISGLKAKIKFDIFYGIILFDTRKTKIYDGFQMFKKVADFSYNVSDTKWPAFNLILKNGWTIKPRLFPVQVRK